MTAVVGSELNPRQLALTYWVEKTA